MHKIKSTYKVLAIKEFQKDLAEEWIDWALEMMESGYETEHLTMLAGLSPHSNRFEFNEVVNKTLKELALDSTTKEEVLYGYVYYIIDQALKTKMSTDSALYIIRDLCRDNDYDNDLMDFYLLAYAKEELKDLGVQFYWEGGDKTNIEAIITSKFLHWKEKYELAAQKSA